METAKRRRTSRSTRMGVTIVEVAAHAGLSTATVSRALAAPDVVSAAARERVFNAIKQTGYTPNAVARNLRAQKTMTILVVVPNITSPFFGEVLRGIDDELVESGYGIIIGNISGTGDRELRYVDLAFAGQVDGILLLGSHVPAGKGRSMTDVGLPLATVCVAIPGLHLPSVVVNDRAISKKVAEHLLDLGHRRFGYISGPTSTINWRDRERGFIAGLKSAGIAPSEVTRWQGQFRFNSGVEIGHDFLARSKRPTAVFAASDNLAIGFMKTITTAGVRVPQDVSIVGFDGLEFADFVEPTLTTVRQPRYEMGRAGARLILSELRGGVRAKDRIELQAELIIGASTGQAPPAQPNP